MYLPPVHFLPYSATRSLETAWSRGSLQSRQKEKAEEHHLAFSASKLGLLTGLWRAIRRGQHLNSRDCWKLVSSVWSVKKRLRQRTVLLEPVWALYLTGHSGRNRHATFYGQVAFSFRHKRVICDLMTWYSRNLQWTTVLSELQLQ